MGDVHDERLRWITEAYRGMYVYALAFKLLEPDAVERTPGQKWGYVVALRYTSDRDAEIAYGPASDRSDYFTREAAEQAALHYGKRAIDIIQDLG